MRKKSEQTDRRRIFLIVCLFFLFGSLLGALAANLLGAAQKAELAAFLEMAMQQEEVPTIWKIFGKYLKYALLIWLGGWTTAGIFVSGAAFLLRSMAVGFSSAAILTAYGIKGVEMIVTTVLPQNLLLIPAYSILMAAAVSMLFIPNQEKGKRTLRRKRRKRRAEYGFVFAGAAVMLLFAAGVEKILLL